MKILLLPALLLALLVGACTTDTRPSRLDPHGWGPGRTDPRIYDYDPAFQQWYEQPYVNPYRQ
jgi:hypothetical protein